MKDGAAYYDANRGAFVPFRADAAVGLGVRHGFAARAAVASVVVADIAAAPVAAAQDVVQGEVRVAAQVQVGLVAEIPEPAPAETPAEAEGVEQGQPASPSLEKIASRKGALP